METRRIIGGSVTIGTRLAYLGQPFTIAELSPLADHPHLGHRWLATDHRQRGVIIYENHPVTVVCG
jgi:hypothetical protein